MSTEEEKCMSFDRAFYNYGRFHANPINKAIHMVFIPVIMITFGIFAASWMPNTEVNDHTITIGPYALSIVFSIVYMMVDFKTGLFFFAWTIPGAEFCSQVYLSNGEIGGFTFWQLAIYCHIFGWISQFIGHGIFEKRAPALVSNLFYTLLAPFFVTFEVLNLFGYKEGAEMDKLYAKIDEDIRNFHG